MKLFNNLKNKTIYFIICLLFCLLCIAIFKPKNIFSIVPFFDSISLAIRVAIGLFVFFINKEYFIPQFLQNKNPINYLVIVGAFVLYIMTLSLIIYYCLILLYQFEIPVDQYLQSSNSIFVESMINILLILFSFGISLIFNYAQKMDVHNENKNQQELIFLKSQINPHFVFNSINCIYSLVLSKSDKAGDALLKLSEVLRYVFSVSEKEFVMVEQELSYIKNFIEFQKMRLTNMTKVIFELDLDYPDKQIAPILLINFIENAFKYGVSNQQASEIFIKISYIDNNWLVLETKNNIFFNHTKSSMIGGENSLKRLEILYPNMYTFENEIEADIYRAKLKLKLL